MGFPIFTAIIEGHAMKIESEAQELRERIAEWESILARGEAMLAHYRAALATLTEEMPDNGDGSTGAPRGKPFSPKYEESSTTLAKRLLATEGEAMTASEVHKALKRQGKKFTRQAVAAALDTLAEKKEIKKKPAPAGSRSKWVFEHPSEDIPPTTPEDEA